MSVFYYEKKINSILDSCSSLDAGIHQIVDDNAEDATDNTGDGQAFFLVLEEQGDQGKQNAKVAKPVAKDVDERNP